MNKKLIIGVFMMIMLSGIAFASVTRSINGNNVVYSSTLGSSHTRAYWAVTDVIPSGCTITDIECVGSTDNFECNGPPFSGDNLIRIVAYTDSNGLNMPTTMSIGLIGSGSCTLSNGQYIESYYDTSSHLGSITSLSPSVNLDFGGGSGCTIYGDSNCDNIIQRSELGVVAQEWMSNPTTTLRTNLGIAAQNWMNNGGPA